MKKNNVKLTTVLVLFLLGGLLLSINSTSLTSLAKPIYDNSSTNPHLQALTPHGPIYIDYDDNFTNPYGFPGAGTPGDPFRIENYNITISGDYPILFSGNNTKHFVIQNCYLWTNTSIGIYLGKYYEMGEGTVKILNNVITTEYQDGIRMNGGNHSVITGNTITTYTYGINVQYGDFSFISENIITGGDEDGIYLELSDNSTLSRNTCLGNSYGIETYLSSNTIISHNNCTHNGDGIMVDEGSNNTVTNNMLVNNDGEGIEANWCYDTLFRNNLLQDNGGYGIRLLMNTADNVIHHNAFIDNVGGASQAQDNGANNIWYDDVALEGNYWNEWVSGSYSIDGAASSVDPYPLSSMPVIPEYSASNLTILMMLAFLSITIINGVYRKKKK